MLQPFKLVDELGRYQAMARMDWEQADSENRALRDKGNGRRWVPDLERKVDDVFDNVPFATNATGDELVRLLARFDPNEEAR